MSSARKISGLACLLTVLAAGGPSYAAGDTLPTSVVDKAKYSMLPYGIRSGSLIFSPGIAVNEMYDDNIFSDENNTKSDFITTVNPSLAVTTDFGMHELFFRAGGSLGYYNEYDDENFQDYNIAGGGRLDLDYNTFASFSSTYKKSHESRDAPDDPNTDEPLEFSLTTHKAQFTRALGLIKLYVEGIYDRFKFSDGTRGGVTVDNSDRDRGIYTITSKLAYEYFPGYNVYIGTRSDWRRYDKTAIIDRDSTGLELQAGTDFEITGKIKGDVYLGHLTREYESDFSNVNAFSYGGSLIWNMSGLTSMTATASRAVEETAYSDASGEMQTSFGMQVDHLLKYNLFLNANAGVTLSDFNQTSNNREDTVYRAGTGIEYMPSNGTSVGLRYQYTERDSNIAGAGNTDNKLILSLKKQF